MSEAPSKEHFATLENSILALKRALLERERSASAMCCVLDPLEQQEEEVEVADIRAEFANENSHTQAPSPSCWLTSLATRESHPSFPLSEPTYTGVGPTVVYASQYGPGARPQ
ncbi:hypothetical protein DFH28DRAFT_925890 [Melampsora americana]|nr:hypothetical protein DFH28DRAFT_925890 [Melampsora americana]